LGGLCKKNGATSPNELAAISGDGTYISADGTWRTFWTSGWTSGRRLTFKGNAGSVTLLATGSRNDLARHFGSEIDLFIVLSGWPLRQLCGRLEDRAVCSK
jgi:hypothetical protein